MTISIIVPVLNEAAVLPQLLEQLLAYQRSGAEVIIADGGSTDGSRQLAVCAGFRVVVAPRGRARQMNAGAALATGQVLLFLHADTRLPDAALAGIDRALARGDHVWGRFDVRLDSSAPIFRAVETGINVRSRLTGIATGDQAMFVRRATFECVGGFPDQLLMEDIELSKRLRVLSPPACIALRAVTSARRWETRGVWRTVFLMWRLRFAYWRGAAPDELARQYR